MSKVQFPKRKADGTFCVEVTLRVTTSDAEELLRRMTNWMNQWVKANQVWIRVWEPSGRVEKLRYDEEFKGIPRIVFSDSREIKIQVDGHFSARWWKDWLVLKIIQELKEAFTEIQANGSIKDCDS